MKGDFLLKKKQKSTQLAIRLNQTYLVMKSIYLSFLFVFIQLQTKVEASDAHNILGGRVLSDGAGVPYIAVYIKGTNTGTITDETGQFTLPYGDFDQLVLGVQGLGYKTTFIDLSQDEKEGNLDINIEPDTLLLEQVLVSGSRVGVLRFLPGSVSFINKAQLENTRPVSANEVLRNIAGVHVVEEEGAGLRANIGIRGLDPDKSRNVLMLEDGVPVALAPYGEPEMYFSPNIDRMSGVEVLKGNGSILFGPQTIGGVINYLTPDAPENPEGRLSIRGGDFGFFNSYLEYGGTWNNTGVIMNYSRKQADNFGPTRFLFHDFNTKIQTRFSPVSQMVFKLGVYDENSNATYVGLTQPMYDRGGYDDLRIAPDDELNVRRYSVSINHKYLLSPGLQLNTTAFGYTTTRNWNRQDFTYSSTASNLSGVVHGEPDGYQGSIYLRNSTGQRNRQFEVAGIEPRLQYRYDLGGFIVKTDAGVRYLYERAFEQRVNGIKPGVLSGDLINDEVRTGHAVSAYVQNNIMLSNRLSIMAGLRNENVRYEREILRMGSTDTLITNTTDVFALIPGAGINYNLTDEIGFFAGLHRGFAPPRTKDAISNEGEDLQLDAEKSWNSEIGLRLATGNLSFETAFFHMNFSNQVIPVSESSGGAGTGYVNGGKTLHYGIEASALMDIAGMLPANWKGSLSLSATYVVSEFSSDRYILQKRSLVAGLDDVYVNVKGNRTPYAPDLAINGGFQIELPAGLGLSVTGNYTGSQYTDVLNTDNVYDWIDIHEADSDYQYVQAVTNGRIGKLDSFFITNLNVWYNFSGSGLAINAGVKNITNQRYIATRRPQGIRAGMPRLITAGINYTF
ncbi:Fe(3+) dicitrate transport protein [Natronoflexus pectinivorans]|uniref:Fe(3+) dicitrate transport protein n=2 Tax=Natronoflexus pectinivorans TaxID=682526 RepID=A0A4R2GJH6_9BACT|nr:Fe(3+) dicitrate transport protein [Natronoflexus pectinivorans]